MNLLKYGLYIALLAAVTTKALAQDVEAIAKAPIATMNGGLSLNQILTVIPGDSTAKNPYALYLAGNINFSFFGVVNIPLSFAYTNNQFNTTGALPFNRFSITPSYKWIKVHAGYTTMQFSPYSLAGHELFGGGIELTPDNGLKVSALFGRLKKADEGIVGGEPAYRRMGGGIKVEYAGKQFDVGINIFKAQDMATSLPDSTAVAPQDNLSGSIHTTISLIKNIRLSAEYGISALNRDIRHRTGGFRLLETAGDVAVYHAVKTNLAYTATIGAIGATYEWVAPNYTTLGAYYMTNDYQNITANLTTAVKVFNIALDVGYQKDNLSEQKTNTTSRMIYSGNIIANIGKKWTVAASLSNIQSYVHINDIYRQVTQTNEFQNLDTLNVTQLNYTVSLNSSYLLQSTEERRQMINGSFMYQKSSEQQDFSDYSGNDIYNTSLAYQYAIVPVKLNASAAINYNYNQMPDGMYVQAITCNLSLQKVFLEDIRTAITCTFSNMTNPTGVLSNVLNIRLTGGYVFWKKHALNLNLALINSKGQSKTQLQYSANLAYSYAFNATVTRKDRKISMKADF
jgi:hypothetical protein